ncbi:MAG: LacI family DNA-binding transcriptional regulator [Christensenellaceae bacterium]|nr:LacI family DNA-binding transcriptional regulator [Christensenellaceae bacterium]
MSTIYDIARAAGVSASTVSRVFSGQGSKQNQELVFRVAKQMNFAINDSAKILKTKKTNRVMLAVPDICNPFYFKMIEGANGVFEQSGYLFMLYYTKHSLEEELKALQLLNQKVVDGMIMVSFHFSKENIGVINQSNYPVVLTNRYDSPDGQDGFDYVYVDTHLGIKLATRHLIELGHRKIAYFGGSIREQTGLERYLGYSDALREASFPLDNSLVYEANYSEREGHASMKALLERHRDVTAVVTSNDLVALGAMTACTEENIAIPGDIAITGMDDTELSNRVTPRLTTVAMQEGEIGRLAATILMERIADASVPRRQIRLAPELIVRESTARAQS